MIGIYKITCIPTGKYYIGSSNNIPKRWYDHKRTLDKQIHANRYLQRAWDKYGEDLFIFEILEYCLEQDLAAVEQSYLNACNKGCVFNIAQDTKNPTRGMNHTDVAKARMARKAIGNEHAVKEEGYIFTDSEGNLIHITNLSKFCRDNALNVGAMHLVATGKKRYYKGYRGPNI